MGYSRARSCANTPRRLAPTPRLPWTSSAAGSRRASGGPSRSCASRRKSSTTSSNGRTTCRRWSKKIDADLLRQRRTRARSGPRGSSRWSPVSDGSSKEPRPPRRLSEGRHVRTPPTLRMEYPLLMRLADVVPASRAVAGTTGRLEKVGHLADLMRRVPPGEIETVIGFLSGAARQGRMGIGGASLSGLRDVRAADAPSLDVPDVDTAFDQIAASSGAGSAAKRAEMLRLLFRRATRDEQDFLLRLLFGELRQGALEGVLMDAVAKASGIAAARLRRAAMLAGDLAPVARAALVDGPGAVSRGVLAARA